MLVLILFYAFQYILGEALLCTTREDQVKVKLKNMVFDDCDAIRHSSEMGK